MFENEDTVAESVWCEIKLSNNDKILVGSIYRSPNSSSENTSNLNTFLKQLKLPSHVLIGGDFNYPEIDWNLMQSLKNDDHKASIFLDTVQDCYLFQHTRHPTHHRADQDPTLIDLVLTNEDEMVNTITHLPPLGKSHHSGLLFDYKCYWTPSRSVNKKVVYKYYAGNYNGMREFIMERDVIMKIRDKSAEEAWQILDKVLNEATEKFVPKQTIRDNFTPPPPWMNDTIRKKSRMKREASEAKKANNNEQSRKQYAKLCNQVKWEVRKAVKQFEQRIAQDSKKNQKRRLCICQEQNPR